MVKSFPAGEKPVNKDAAAGTSLVKGVTKFAKSGFKTVKKGVKWAKNNPKKAAALAAATGASLIAGGPHGTALAAYGAHDIYNRTKGRVKKIIDAHKAYNAKVKKEREEHEKYQKYLTERGKAKREAVLAEQERKKAGG